MNFSLRGVKDRCEESSRRAEEGEPVRDVIAPRQRFRIPAGQ